MGALDGKRALVTGAGQGIGQGIAIELARQGASVAVHYCHSVDGARSAVAEIEGVGKHACLVQGDLHQVAACLRVIDDAVARLGGLDILVNNAGVSLSGGILDMTEATYRAMFDLNMQG